MELLVVDDDSTFRDELGEFLREEGHQVAVASSVPKALEELERKDYDLVLTDLRMPRHSGLELLQEVRRRWPRTFVVMITGFSTVETAVQAMKAGAFDYIRKPFKTEQVRQVLELAKQEMGFQSGGNEGVRAATLARRWAADAHLEVLLVSPRATKTAPGVTAFDSTGAEPYRVQEVVESFLASHEKAGIIIEDAHLLFEGRRKEDVTGLLARLRERSGSHGPFVVTVDPRKLPSGDLSDIRASVLASETHATLEVLGSPLRRTVLRRVAKGPCTFTQAMEAAGLDDSPKLSFHLRKLTDEGLIEHRGEEYRITPKGTEACRLLGEIDAMAPTGARGSSVLISRAES
jgi:CheY-like chemotaxis protein/DNA-binding HxlR family transcriptional regulator